MRTRKSNLLIVAHPDDETIFFTGPLLQIRRNPWHVVCVTDGNADGRGQQRRQEFHNACKKLKVAKTEHWDFHDIFEERLDLNRLEQRLLNLPTPDLVYTHGVIGEYGHPHHQDVSYSVHKLFSKTAEVWSVAHNCFPEKVLKLTASQYALKTKILMQIYGKETQRFLHLLSATPVESFVRLNFKEVQMIYDYLCGRAPLDPRLLKAYRWLEANMPRQAEISRIRPF